jgi:hypothetical protein
VLYQVWAFVAPGLYAHEKRLVLPLVAASVFLFFVGMAFAYLLVFPTVFGFMSQVAPEGVAWMTDIEKYLSFVLTTFIAFGVTFEVPVVVIVLVKAGVVEHRQAQGMAAVRDRRRFRRRRRVHAAGRDFTDDDGHSAVPAFRTGACCSRVLSASARHTPRRLIRLPRKPRSRTLTADWTPLSAQEMDAAIEDLGTQPGTRAQA